VSIRKLQSLCVFIAMLVMPVASFGASSAKDLVRDFFATGRAGTGLVIKQVGSLRQVEVCFDQCDFFEWKASELDTKKWDFIALYEVYKGVLSDSDDYLSIVKARSSTLSASWDSGCPHQIKMGHYSSTCDWLETATSERITVGKVIYDEGRRCLLLLNTSHASRQRCGPLRGRTPFSPHE
jgi:hypothetical protein